MTVQQPCWYSILHFIIYLLGFSDGIAKHQYLLAPAFPDDGFEIKFTFRVTDKVPMCITAVKGLWLQIVDFLLIQKMLQYGRKGCGDDCKLAPQLINYLEGIDDFGQDFWLIRLD